MPLLEHGRLAEDPWVRVADDAPLPEGPALLSPARLRREATAGRNAPLGLELPPDVSPDEVAELLPRVAVVALRLPKFKDGRAFTQARALREHYGFRGTIRVGGHVIPDQATMLRRVGVDAIELPEGADPAQWQESARAVTIAYQPARTPDAPLAGLRRRIA